MKTEREPLVSGFWGAPLLPYGESPVVSAGMLTRGGHPGEFPVLQHVANGHPDGVLWQGVPSSGCVGQWV